MIPPCQKAEGQEAGLEQEVEGIQGYSLVVVEEIQEIVVEPVLLAAILVWFLPREEIWDIWIHQECQGIGLQSALQAIGWERLGQIQMKLWKKGYIAWEGLVEVDWDCDHWTSSAVSSWWPEELETEKVAMGKRGKCHGQVLEPFGVETHQ